MAPASDDLPRRAAEHYSGARAKMLNEAYKVLVLLLGGAVVALLGFLQGAWDTQPGLARAMLGGMVWFVGGIFFATFIPLLRYLHSTLWEKHEKAARDRDERQAAGLDRLRKPFRYGFLACFVIAMMCFVVGAGRILHGAWLLLPPA